MNKVFIRRSRNQVGQASSLSGRQEACPILGGCLALNFIGKRRSTFLLVLGAVAISSVCGCGGGASTKPTVTAKPREDAVDNGGGPKTSNSKAPVAEGIGTFKGVIKFDGTPPVMGLLPANKDAVCIANRDKIKDQSLIVNSGNKGIKNVFVYLAKKPKGVEIAPPPEMPDTFDQKFCTFLPHAKIVRVGRTLNILNDDNVLHNTHTYPLKSPKFNQGVNPGNRKGLPTIFNAPERLPVKVVCDIHTWMTAWILPLDHDFAAITDENGQFEIKGLPAGEHEFVIWQEKAERLERKFKVTIQADQTTEKNLSFGAKDFE